MKNNKTPEIRFSEFADGWEQHALGEFLKESRISGTNGLIAKKLTVKLWRKGVVPKEEIIKGSKATKYYVRRSGQFIYGKLDFLNQAFGIVPQELDGYESTLDSPAFDILGDLNSIFLIEYVSRKQFYLYQGTLANGSRKAKRIHVETFFDMPIALPSIREQNKIGQLFTELDAIIALHQQKLNNLKQTKQGFLQKMFPKEGETVPELRFPGFTDNWEQKKLEIFVWDHVEKTTIQNQYPVLTSSQKHGITNQKDYFSNRQVTTESNIGYFVLPRGYFTFRSRSDNGVFKFNRNDIIDKGIISYFYPVFQIVNGDSDFFLTMLNTAIKKQVSLEAEGTGQRVLSLKKFKNIKTLVPNIEEQIKIGKLFKDLDDIITLRQQELDILKQTKKAFLQKMFI